MRPSRTANATACERLRALSFVTTSCSTFFTVRSEYESSSATSRVGWPAAISARTCCSRSVSRAGAGLGLARSRAAWPAGARAGRARRRWSRRPPRAPPRTASPASARPCAGSRPRPPEAPKALHPVPASDAQTITRAPIALAHARHEIRAAGQRRVDEHEVGLEQRRVLPRVAHPLGIGDRLDLFEQVQTGHQSPAVDRMGVEDEELHP